jgi:hypothetical protein
MHIYSSLYVLTVDTPQGEIGGVLAAAGYTADQCYKF